MFACRMSIEQAARVEGDEEEGKGGKRRGGLLKGKGAKEGGRGVTVHGGKAKGERVPSKDARRRREGRRRTGEWTCTAVYWCHCAMTTQI